jgi:hypothetical protein
MGTGEVLRPPDGPRLPTHHRQIYASLISELEVDVDDKETNRQLVDVSFPRLVSLFLRRRQPNPFSPGPKPLTDIASLRQFMGSALRISRLNYVADAEVLHYVQVIAQAWRRFASSTRCRDSRIMELLTTFSGRFRHYGKLISIYLQLTDLHLYHPPS